MLHKTSASSRAHLSRLFGVIAIGLFSFSGKAQASDLSVVGPLEAVDCKGQQVRVLGVDFLAVSPASLATVCAIGSPSELVYVALSAKTRGDSKVEISKIRIVSRGAYVPGASQVYLRGRLTG